MIMNTVEWHDSKELLPAMDFHPEGRSTHVLTCDKDSECRGVSYCQIEKTKSGHDVFWKNITDKRCIVKWWAYLPGVYVNRNV